MLLELGWDDGSFDVLLATAAMAGSDVGYEDGRFLGSGVTMMARRALKRLQELHSTPHYTFLPVFSPTACNPSARAIKL